MRQRLKLGRLAQPEDQILLHLHNLRAKALAQFDADGGVLHNQIAQCTIGEHPVVNERDGLCGHILGCRAEECGITQNAAGAERGQRLAALGCHAHKALFQHEETACRVSSAEEGAAVVGLALGEALTQLFALGVGEPGKKRRKCQELVFHCASCPPAAWAVRFCNGESVDCAANCQACGAANRKMKLIVALEGRLPTVMTCAPIRIVEVPAV